MTGREIFGGICRTLRLAPADKPRRSALYYPERIGGCLEEGATLRRYQNDKK